jgi:hypothetical protein
VLLDSGVVLGRSLLKDGDEVCKRLAAHMKLAGHLDLDAFGPEPVEPTFLISLEAT